MQSAAGEPDGEEIESWTVTGCNIGSPMQSAAEGAPCEDKLCEDKDGEVMIEVCACMHTCMHACVRVAQTHTLMP
jgi:hypothetical protein